MDERKKEIKKERVKRIGRRKNLHNGGANKI